MAETEFVNWEFHLAESATMNRLGLISQARNRTLEVIHNKPGSCSFNVPVLDEMWENIEPIHHCVIAYRNSMPIWSGPIWSMDDHPPKIVVNCVGWFELLNHRELRQDVSYPRFVEPAITITGGEIVFDDPVGVVGDPDYYPGGLLTQANDQQDTWISEGVSTDVMERVIPYQRGQKIGEAITNLTEIEAGFDFTIDPLTRVMDISNWDEYRDRSVQAQFGYNWGPNNLSDFSRLLDASTMANRVTAMGDYGGGLAEDPDAQAFYQLFEETISLAGVVDPDVLLAYAGGEVILRGKPRVVFSLQPFPWSIGRTPEPFVDYAVGDVIEFSAQYGRRIQIDKQKARVFGITVTITDEGNEKISPLQITP